MEKLKNFFGEDWCLELNDFLKSPAFEAIGQKLKVIKKSNEIAPLEKNIFKAFKECPWKKLHTVIIGDYPYTTSNNFGIPTADGLAFSAKNSMIGPKILDRFLEKIDEEIYNDSPTIWCKNNLTEWANSGVLLLNVSLTTNLKKMNKLHYFIWKSFIQEVLKTINKRKEGVAFILLGREANSLKPLLSNNTFAIYSAEHPRDSVIENRTWYSEDVFKKLQAFHKFYNNTEIKFP